MERVAPVGTRTVEALMHGRCAMQVYPPSPWGDAIHMARKASGIGLRDAAARVGITAAELSAIEIGCARIVEEDDYADVLDRLLGACP